MKNTVIVLLAITTVAFGAACFVQWRNVETRTEEAVLLQTDLEQKTAEILALEAAEQQTQRERNEAVEKARNLATQLRAQPGAGEASRSTPVGGDVALPDAKSDKPNAKAGFGSMLEKMMSDPEMKKMIRDQQRVVLDQLYSPLAKQLNLTSEETERIKDLLADNLMKGAEQASSLFGDSATNRTDAFASLAEKQKTLEENIRGFLGEGRYAQYQEYQQTVGERAQLNQYRLQNGSGENALTDAQVEKLLGFMKEEKQSVAAATGQPLPGEHTDAATMQAMFSGEGAEKVIQYQETLNKQVLGRAKDVLSVAQLGAFEKFQADQLKMMRMGMTMAQKMMASDKSSQP